MAALRLLPMFMNFCIDLHSIDLLISSGCVACGSSVLHLPYTKMMKARNEGACNIVCMKTLFFVFTFLFLVSRSDQLTASATDDLMPMLIIIFYFLVNVSLMWYFEGRLIIHVHGT